MVHARALKFHRNISHEKIVDTYFFHIRIMYSKYSSVYKLCLELQVDNLFLAAPWEGVQSLLIANYEDKMLFNI